MATLRRYLLPALVVLALAVAAAIALRPAPVPVDTAPVTRSRLVVTVDDDGKTRVRERYVVFTPLAGRLERIALDAGDPIKAGETILAALEPSDPALLDARTVAEAEARVKSAEAQLQRSSAQRIAAVAALEFAQNELIRRTRAGQGGAATEREVEDAALLVTLRTQEHRAAEFAEQVAQFEIDQARAALLRTRAAPAAPGDSPDWRFTIPAPIDGRVLRVLRDSAGFVAAGTPLLEIGDPRDLEFEIDVLSDAAVKIRPGAPVIIERWGGETPLKGHVRTIEPSGFTKISALGVEEQRVNIIGDFDDPPDKRPALADGFRIEARIVVEDVEHALVAPSGAFFRHAGGWAAYRVERDRARLVPVTLGRRNDRDVEVLSGLDENDELILYPSDRVEESVRIRRRPAAPR
jgi:HlyD family secretion protein